MFFFSDDFTFHQQPVHVVEHNFTVIAKNVILLARGVYE